MLNKKRKNRRPGKAVAERGLRDTIIEICTESYKSRCPEKAVAERDQQGYSTENFVRSYRSRCPNKEQLGTREEQPENRVVASNLKNAGEIVFMMFDGR